MENFDKNLFIQCCFEALECSIESDKNLSPRGKRILKEAFLRSDKEDIISWVFEGDFVEDINYFLIEAEELILSQEVLYEDTFGEAKKRIEEKLKKTQESKHEGKLEIKLKSGDIKTFKVRKLPDPLKDLYHQSKNHEIKYLENLKKINELSARKIKRHPTDKKLIEDEILKLRKENMYHREMKVKMMDRFKKWYYTKINILSKFKYKTSKTVGDLYRALTSTRGLITVGSIALAAVVFYIAHRSYKKKLAEKTGCAKKVGKEREKCIRKVRIDALDIEIANLQKGVAACDESNNPKKCRLTINKKIEKLKKKKWKLSRPYIF